MDRVLRTAVARLAGDRLGVRLLHMPLSYDVQLVSPRTISCASAAYCMLFGYLSENPSGTPSYGFTEILANGVWFVRTSQTLTYRGVGCVTPRFCALPGSLRDRQFLETSSSAA
jgi:hypothetical protein